MGDSPEPEPVYRITNVDPGLTEDQSGRQRRYLISMAIRTLCFVVAIIVSGPLRWVFLGLAIFLPYLAVVVANAGRERTKHADLRVMPGPPTALTPTPPSLSGAPAPPPPDGQGRPSPS